MGKLLDWANENIFNPIGDTFKKVGEGIETFGHNAENSVKEAFTQIGNSFSNVFGTLNNSSNEFVNDLSNGVSDLLGIETENEIKDESQNGIESTINGADITQWMEEQQQKQWERENAIRAEIQAREDSAIQRAVADARAAGINPNLMNIQAAESGGGITNSTGLDYSVYNAEMEKILTLIEQEIDNEFKGDENKKDRWSELFKTIMALMIFKK